MTDDVRFTPIPRPARVAADGQPYPVCPCGEVQATYPVWVGWRGCPCGGATGEVCRAGTAHWLLFDRRLVDERRKARSERQDAAIAERVRGRIKGLTTKR